MTLHPALAEHVRGRGATRSVFDAGEDLDLRGLELLETRLGEQPLVEERDLAIGRIGRVRLGESLFRLFGREPLRHARGAKEETRASVRLIGPARVAEQRRDAILPRLTGRLEILQTLFGFLATGCRRGLRIVRERLVVFARVGEHVTELEHQRAAHPALSSSSRRRWTMLSLPRSQ